MTDPPRAERTASRLAQLLGETIVHHAPHTAKISVDEARRQVTEWLDGREAHLARFIGPFLQRVLDTSDPPPAVRALLEEAINPSEAFTESILQIFLWGIVSSIVSTAVDPFLQAVSNDLNTAAVNQTVTTPGGPGQPTQVEPSLGGAPSIVRPVDPGTIATAAGRGLNLGDAPTVNVPAWAYQQAAQQGVGADEVDLMASIIGLPPAMQQLFEMYRRGIITQDQVETGLREGDFRDDWISYAIQLIHGWLTPLDFVRAAVQEQMTYTDAQAWAQKTGLDTTTSVPVVTGDTEATPDMFGLAFSIAGRPPGIQELGRMANRGIIDWTGTGADAVTFQQGVAESDTKTKWTPSLQALQTYVPPPRQIGTLLEHGAITETQAEQYWADGGVPAELVAGYVYMTEQQHTTQDKLLAKGEILTGYYDGIFTDAQATELLGLLGYRDQVAADILSIVDFRREIQAINMVVRKIGTLYTNFKITATDATTALDAVGVTGDQASNLLATWDNLRIAPVRVPSPTEIGGAWKYGTITQAEGLAALEVLGYQPRDAAIVLSSYGEGQVTPLPAAGTTVTG